MTQVSFPLQQLVSWFQTVSRALLELKYLRRLGDHIRRARGWLLALSGFALLYLWNWQWVVAIAAGMVAMVLVYLVQQRQFRISWQGWRSLWRRSNRTLTFSVGCGIVATLSVYTATAIWVESKGSWLAIGLIGQGLVTLLLLLLFVGQWLNRRPERNLERNDRNLEQFPHAIFNQMLLNLADPDPLKRLIAIRQVTSAVMQANPVTQANPSSGNLLSMTSNQLADCFRLMLNRETEAIVCSALLESLRVLNGSTPQLEGTSLSSVSLSSVSLSAQADRLKVPQSSIDQ